MKEALRLFLKKNLEEEIAEDETKAEEEEKKKNVAGRKNVGISK